MAAMWSGWCRMGRAITGGRLTFGIQRTLFTGRSAATSRTRVDSSPVVGPHDQGR
jgi:hypothetical protein